MPIVACSNESIMLMFKRWQKLKVDFSENHKYNISKIPDINDALKYDILHNSNVMD